MSAHVHEVNQKLPTDVLNGVSSAAGIGPLAEFLRSRHQRLIPDRVGIHTRGTRRVPGLRRAEVATRAGISERNPSRAVCDALANALTLDRYETGHLYELAGPRMHSADVDSLRPEIPDGSRILLQSMTTPAVIQTRYTDVLASNPMAEALSPALHCGVHRVRALFVDPSERAMHLDRNRITAHCVAQLRCVVGADPTETPARELVAELLQHSELFRGLWSRHEVSYAPISPVHLLHPNVGCLELFREKLILTGTDDLAVAVFHAEPSSRSWSALRRLTDLTDTARPS